MKRHRDTSITLAGLVFLSLFAGAPAWAEPSAADRQTARTLLLEGRKAFAEKDFQGALKSFKAAHALMGVPTTGLDLARAYEALGQLVEARATAFEASLFPEKPNEPGAFTDARKAAGELAARLDARVPSLNVQITGPQDAKVVIDGQAIPNEAIGVPRKLNPGEHEVVVSAPGHATERRKVTLKDGEATPVELRVELSPAAPLAPTAEPPTPLPSEPPPEVERPVPVWAWVAGGVGVAALGVSVGFAVMHASVRSEVARECPGNVCDSNSHDIESMQALRARWDQTLGLSLGFGALGLAGVGTGVAGLILRPGKGPASAFSPVIQPGFQGVVGRGAF